MTDLLKSVISKAKEFVQLAKLIPKLKTQNSELQMELANLKIAHAAIKMENMKLKATLYDETSNPLVYNGFIYRCKDGFAHCPACYDNHKKRIHLKPVNSPLYSFNTDCFRCTTCGEKFEEYF